MLAFSKTGDVTRADRRLAAAPTRKFACQRMTFKISWAAHHTRMFSMPRDVVSELAPTGVLRAAINMGNFLLVTGKSPSGDPEGVSPDMALANSVCFCGVVC